MNGLKKNYTNNVVFQFQQTKQEATLLVGPKYGISHVVNAKVHVVSGFVLREDVSWVHVGARVYVIQDTGFPSERLYHWPPG